MKKHYFMAFYLVYSFYLLCQCREWQLLRDTAVVRPVGGSGGGFGGVTTVDDYSDHYSRASWEDEGMDIIAPMVHHQL